MMQKQILGRSQSRIGLRSSVPSLRARNAVCRAHHTKDASFQANGAALGLAAVLALSGIAGPIISTPPAWADEEAELSPFEKRQAEAQRRRDLLRQARERAEQKNEAEGATASEDVEAERRYDTGNRKLSVQQYDQEAAKGIKAPPANPYENSPLNFSLPPPPEKLSDIKVPDLSNFEMPKFEAPKLNFEMPKFEAPEPQAPPPPPPAPEPKPAAPMFRPAPPPPPPAPVKEVPRSKAEPPKETANEAAKPGKRRGPLPAAVAELLVLALLAGVGAAATKFNEQSSKALSAAGKLVVDGYSKLEAAVAKK